MNNRKQIQTNRHNTNPERKQVAPPVVVRTTVIHNAGKRLIIARDAEMRLQQRAPKHPEELFRSGYAEWLARQAVTAANDNVSPINGNAKESPKAKEHEVAENISEHEVTDKPQKANIDLTDNRQEQAADDFILDAMAADSTPELSEAPTGPIAISGTKDEGNDQNAAPIGNSDKDKEQMAQIYRLAEIRRRVMNTKPKDGKEISENIQNLAA